MEELEDIHANRTKYVFTTMEAVGDEWDPVKLAKVPSSLLLNVQSDTFIVVL